MADVAAAGDLFHEEPAGREERDMRSLVFLVLLWSGVCLTLAGCDVDVRVADLNTFSRAIDELRAQAAKTTGEGGDLCRLLDKAKADLDDLIKQGRDLKQEVLDDFIKQKKGLILDIARLLRESGIEVQGILHSVPPQFENAVKRLPKEVVPHLYGVIALMPSLWRDTTVYHTEGMRIAFQPEGKHRVSIVIPKAFNLSLRLNQRVVRPVDATAVRVQFELPISELKSFFQDLDETPLPVELVDNKEVRYVGQLRLEALFPVKYKLTERGPKGETQPLIIDQGIELWGMLEWASQSLQASGAPPETIPVAVASRQGRIYRLASERLPYGTSEVTLSPAFDDWELLVTPEIGAAAKLDRNYPSAAGTLVTWKWINREDGSRALHLTLRCERP